MFKKSRLISICEGLTSVYKVSGFNIGDQIKIDKEAFAHEAFKSLPKEIQDKFTDMVKAEEVGDAIISIAGINRSAVNPDMKSATIEIGINGGGNIFYNRITIPYELVQFVNKISDGINMPAIIAPNDKITYENDPTAVELTADNMKGKEKIDNVIVPAEEPIRDLPKVNVVLPSAKSEVEEDYKKNIKKKVDLAPNFKP